MARGSVNDEPDKQSAQQRELNAQLAAASPAAPPPLPPDTAVRDAVAGEDVGAGAAEDADRDEVRAAAAATPESAEQQPGHEFLVPGPNEYSNTGTLRWGLTWVLFSLLLIVFMLALSFVCWLLASWTGLG